MEAANRVLALLPERLEKAKQAVADLERENKVLSARLEKVSNVLWWIPSEPVMARQVIESILEGNHDDVV